jgi:hypothetical protein
MRSIVGIVILVMFSIGTLTAQTVFQEGFNSGFTNPYAISSFAYEFGITSPGIVTDGSISGIEGNGLAALNNGRTNAGSVASIVGGMDISLGTVAAAGITYTFSGDFGWRYGTLAAASDNAISYGQSGFVVGSTTHTAGDFKTFNFGTSTAGSGILTNYTFSYTTVAGDVGQSITARLRLQDNNTNGTLTQLLTDNWIITIDRHARLSLIVITSN